MRTFEDLVIYATLVAIVLGPFLIVFFGIVSLFSLILGIVS